jgi:hypothetical protein
VATENFVRIAAIAFLTNHASQIMAADLFVVPTVTFRLLFVLVTSDTTVDGAMPFRCMTRRDISFTIAIQSSPTWQPLSPA